MTRKIGKLGAARAGTGTVDSTSGKWADSVAAQVATAAQVKGIITKTIPVAYVLTDPENPRRLAISQSQIIEISKTYALDKQLLDASDKTDWIENYIQKVGDSENLSGKALGDFASLVNFSAALKSADRMLHPIVVTRKESTFHLIAGERRLLAHILLGESHIAARMTDQEYDRSAIDTLQWEENVHRVDMNLWERVERVKKIIESGDGIERTSVTQLSKIIGRSRAECQRYLAILRYPTSDLIQAIKEGKINDLKKAASLAQLNPADLIDVLLGKRPKLHKPAITFTNKEKVPAFGLIIKAAAQKLKMDQLINTLDLNTPTGINSAVDALLLRLEEQNLG